jgi:hypothetical protein
LARLEVAFSRDAAKQYKQLPGEYRVLVDVALLRLSQGSGVDLKPVVGERDVYRIRGGQVSYPIQEAREHCVGFQGRPQTSCVQIADR